MPSNPVAFTYAIQDIVRLSSVSYSAVYKAVSRRELDPSSLEAVVLWLCRHGSRSLRHDILSYGFLRETHDNPAVGKRKVRTDR